MEYKIIHGKSEEKIESEINELAKNGWKLISFHTSPYGGGGFLGSGNVAVYCHAIMVNEKIR